jgi:CRP-like cAMP-binding protein
VILAGTAEVRRQGRHLRELGPGDFFGEIALLDGGPRTATVTALSPMKCLVLSRGEFHNVIRQNALIAVSVLQTLGERLRTLLAGQAT